MEQPVLLLIGGTGYVGQFLVQAFLERGAAVHVTHRPRREAVVCAERVDMVEMVGFEGNYNEADWLPAAVGRHALDFVVEPEAIARVLAEVRPSIVVNCAAMSDLGGCQRDPAGAEAVNCPRQVVEIIAREAHGAPRLFIHFSTDIVFGGDPALVYDEEATPTPVNVYGRLKADFDAFLASTTEPTCIVLRSSNILGPRHPYMSLGTKFLQWLDGRMRSGEPTKLFDDEYRNFVWVEDLVAMVMRLVEDFPTKSQPYRLFHCGGPDSLSRVDVARILCAAKGYDIASNAIEGAVAPQIVPTPRADVDLGYPTPLEVRMSSARAEALLGRGFRSVSACLIENASRI